MNISPKTKALLLAVVPISLNIFTFQLPKHVMDLLTKKKRKDMPPHYCRTI